MTYTITLQPSARQFTTEPNETVLAAALRQGIQLSYGCQNGGCGTCRCKLISGHVTHKQHALTALSEADERASIALLCSAYAQTDLSLECSEISGVAPPKRLPCRIRKMEQMAPDVMLLELQLPSNEKFQYLAGQYINFVLKDGKKRSYSIANASQQQGYIELHIRHMPGGLFTDALFTTMRERDMLRFEGPLGTFFLREETLKPIILLASGTGFAPIKAMIEHMMQEKINRSIVFYWGGRQKQDLYHYDLAEDWAHAWPYFKFIPVIERADATWTGKTGWVHQAVMQDFPDMSSYEVYACGAPQMIEAARKDFIEQCQLPMEAFYSDAFSSEADLNQVV